MAVTYTQFSLTFRDGLGTEKATQAYLTLDDTRTLADLATAYQDWVTGIATISDARALRGQIKVQPFFTFPATPNLASSRVEQTGVLGFSEAGTDRKWSMEVPAVADTALNGDRIDLGNTDVTALIAIMTSYIGATFVSSHGIALTGLADAFVSFHKARKQLQRSSFETA